MEFGVGQDPVELRALTSQHGAVVRPVRLIATVGLGVASDLSRHGLEALADLGGDRLHRCLGRQSVGDRNPVILSQEAGRDRRIGDGHAASIDEPQRAAARRHADASRRGGTPVTGADEIEVMPFGRGRHLVVSPTRHQNIPPGDVRNHHWTSTAVSGDLSRRDHRQNP